MENVRYIESDMCRICFESDQNMVSLNNEECDKSPYEKLLQYTNININVGNGEPTSICRQCFEELNVCVKFLNKCYKAHEILQGHNSFPDTVVKILEPQDDQQHKEDCDNQQIKSNDKLKQTCVKCDEESCVHNKGYTCQSCCKMFTRKFNLKLHERRGCAPPPPRKRVPRACPHCGNTYTSHTNLTNHIRTHSGERPFACPDCSKTFGSKKTLNDHKRIHTGIKPYMCPICGKQFTTNKLSSHMRTHSPAARAHATTHEHAPSTREHAPSTRGQAASTREHEEGKREAAHACSLCPARYNHKQSLNKHIRKRHGMAGAQASWNV